MQRLDTRKRKGKRISLFRRQNYLRTVGSAFNSVRTTRRPLLSVDPEGHLCGPDCHTRYTLTMCSFGLSAGNEAGGWRWIFSPGHKLSQTRIRVEKCVKSFFRQIVGKYFVICAFKAQGSTEYLTSCRKIEAIFEEGCNITLCEVSAVFESLRLP